MSELIFYKFPVTKQAFYISKYSFAIVNLKPLTPGHVLVVSKRVVQNINDLTTSESTDFFQSVSFISSVIKSFYKSDALNVAIQDGLAAGQSIPHLHCHIIPRYLNDNYRNDMVYPALEFNEGMLMKDYWWKEKCKGFETLSDDERKPRTNEEMEQETNTLKEFIDKLKSESKS